MINSFMQPALPRSKLLRMQVLKAALKDKRTLILEEIITLAMVLKTELAGKQRTSLQ